MTERGDSVTGGVPAQPSAISLERSWLVQRLERPHQLPADHRFAALSEVFSFGGGYKNGGLSDKAMGMLREVWSFDYMGSAEFEWGAVPEALSKIAKSELSASTFTIALAEVAANWRDKSKTVPEGEAVVYLLAPQGWEAEIERRVRAWAAESTEREFATKEATRLSGALRPVEEWDNEVRGWLELDNGFLFFVDEPMWVKACSLFGVEAGVTA